MEIMNGSGGQVPRAEGGNDRTGAMPESADPPPVFAYESENLDLQTYRPRSAVDPKTGAYPNHESSHGLQSMEDILNEEESRSGDKMGGSRKKRRRCGGGCLKLCGRCLGLSCPKCCDKLLGDKETIRRKRRILILLVLTILCILGGIGGMVYSLTSEEKGIAFDNIEETHPDGLANPEPPTPAPEAATPEGAGDMFNFTMVFPTGGNNSNNSSVKNDNNSYLFLSSTSTIVGATVEYMNRCAGADLEPDSCVVSAAFVHMMRNTDRDDRLEEVKEISRDDVCLEAVPPTVTYADLEVFLYSLWSRDQCQTDGPATSMSAQELRAAISEFRRLFDKPECFSRLCAEDPEDPSRLLFEVRLIAAARCASIEMDGLSPCLVDRVFEALLDEGQEKGVASKSDREEGYFPKRRRDGQLRRKLQEAPASFSLPTAAVPCASRHTRDQWMSMLEVVMTGATPRCPGATPLQTKRVVVDLATVFAAHECWGANGCREEVFANNSVSKPYEDVNALARCYMGSSSEGFSSVDLISYFDDYQPSHDYACVSFCADGDTKRTAVANLGLARYQDKFPMEFSSCRVDNCNEKEVCDPPVTTGSPAPTVSVLPSLIDPQMSPMASLAPTATWPSLEGNSIDLMPNITDTNSTLLSSVPTTMPVPSTFSSSKSSILPSSLPTTMNNSAVSSLTPTPVNSHGPTNMSPGLLLRNSYYPTSATLTSLPDHSYGPTSLPDYSHGPASASFMPSSVATSNTTSASLSQDGSTSIVNER